MLRWIFSLYVMSSLLCGECKAQDIIFKSVKITPPSSAEWDLPVLDLGSGQQIQVHFDDVADRDLNLRYRLVHCNPSPGFPPSNLKEIEYINGQNGMYIEQADLSMSTRVNYVHYSFPIPGAYQQLKVSGIYKVEVFESDQPNKILLSLPFLVRDPQVIIKSAVSLPKNVSYRFLKQELGLEIIPMGNSPLRITDPNRNLKVYVQQNMNPRTARRIPMQYSSGQGFIYKDVPELIFDGLNEFRNFDIRPLSYNGRNVQRLELGQNIWNAFLYNQKTRLGSNYVETDDINGNFVIHAHGFSNSNVEGDYAFVHFYLDMPWDPSCEYFVTGRFNQWQTNEASRLTFESDINLHSVSILCKQGFYDYMFLQRKNGIDQYVPVEGNFQETENDYYIFVFYCEPGGRYEQLVGIAHLNSRK